MRPMDTQVVHAVVDSTRRQLLLGPPTPLSEYRLPTYWVHYNPHMDQPFALYGVPGRHISVTSRPAPKMLSREAMVPMYWGSGFAISLISPACLGGPILLLSSGSFSPTWVVLRARYTAGVDLRPTPCPASIHTRCDRHMLMS